MSHQERVQRIATELREWAARGESIDFTKGGVSHVVPDPHAPVRKRPKLDIGALKNILSLDVSGKTCVAEPGVTFTDLVRTTLAHGLVPYTVPELKTITIGGAVAGCSVESMSYKYGGFHDSCLEYEVITGFGEVLTCSPTQDAELFQMIHGSYGTLGILSKLTFKLHPAKPYVRMDYVSFERFEDFARELFALCEARETDFIDAIIHGPKKHVLCLGTFVDQAPYLRSYDWLNVFYKSTAERREDYLRTHDYFFRYDADCHWLTRSAPIPGLETKLMRFLLGGVLLGSTNLLAWSQRLQPLLRFKKHNDVVVDVFIPANRWAEFHEWYAREFDYYPLWIVPYREPIPYPWINPKHAAEAGTDLFIDCAIYGKRNDKPGVNYHALLEEKVFELKGIKTLISENSYDEARFWEIYHRDLYERVKARTDPRNVFGGLYERTHRRKV
jgi:FAD/FMN-containing dehydrogenase